MYVDLGKRVRTCIHHYSIIPSVFTALKISALCSHPSLPLTPGNHWFLYCVHHFAFSRMSYSTRPFQIGNMHLRFLHISSWLTSSVLFSTEWYSIVRMNHSLFIHHPLKNILGASKFWQLWMKLLCTAMCGLFCEQAFSPLDTHQRARLLDHRVKAHLV